MRGNLGQFFISVTSSASNLLKAISRFRRALKIAKLTVSFVMSVCPSAWNNSVPSRQLFMKYGI